MKRTHRENHGDFKIQKERKREGNLHGTFIIIMRKNEVKCKDGDHNNLTWWELPIHITHL
jgi:hypothetical protein